ncbi:hypothetical protein LBMAG52_00080 [Planctomycetia bacterium]|nr:hypothetical protein LBMAG52_00080 [Planctomycetia bacterium]
MLTSRVLLLVVLVFAAAFSRLVPHLHNAAPVAAMTLFAAAYLPNRRWSLLLPLAAMFLSDVVLYATKDVAYREQAVSNMLFVYSTFAVIALLGQSLRQRVTIGRVIGTTLAGSAVFFLITNFGAWLSLSATEPAMYSRTLSGLMNCYIAGVPFFRGTFVGDLVYSAVLFGGFALLEQAVPQLKPRLVEATIN